MTDAFQARLGETAAATERMLDRLLTPEAQRGEVARPASLIEAMRAAALAPGRRLHPFLLAESARIFGRADEGVVRAAAAIECVHVYGRLRGATAAAAPDHDLGAAGPGLARVEAEAVAMLAGDALLALAFDILADPAVDLDPLTCAALVGALARAAGVGGMTGGHMLDRTADEASIDEAAIRHRETMRTGSLFRYACQAGAFLGHALEAERHHLIGFGEKFGLVVRLADDLDDAAAGRMTNRATLVSLHGIDQAKTLLAVAGAEAAALLEPFGAHAEILADAARFLAGHEG